ncbi:MAG: penicillin-binding protein 2 [Patescibacteria group bacterium]
MEDNNEIKKESVRSDFFGLSMLGDGQLNRRSHSRWTEEAFINFSDKEVKKSDKIFMGLSISGRALMWFLVFVLSGLGILLARSVQLQVIEGSEYLSIAEQNRLRIHYIKAPRGIIYDRQLRPLVANIPNFHVYITPFDFPKAQEQQNEIKRRLQDFLGSDLGEKFDDISKITSRQREYFEPMLLYENIPYENAIKLMIQTYDMPGVSVEYDTRRSYYSEIVPPNANESYYQSLSHILGYEGKLSEAEYDDLRSSGYLLNDRIGKSGLEKNYEVVLRGKNGKRQVEVDSTGKEKKIIAKEDPKHGEGVILSVDIEIQNKLEELIRNALESQGKRKAVGIAMDPRNGEILAMVSLPSYNNNDFAVGISPEKYQVLIENPDNPLFNLAIKGEYPSGSTIKPVIASAALEEGIVTENTSFLSTGGLRIGQWFFPDWLAGGHGLTNIKKAIADSVNTYFYMVGGGYGDFEGLGVKRINYYGALFGLSQPTGIDLPGESTGFLPTPEWKVEAKNEPWYIGDTYHLSIGQGDLLVTPLQVANYIAFFANKGTLYVPHLVKAYVDPVTKENFPVADQVARSGFIDPKNIEIVRQGLRQGVTFGSGRILNSLPVTSASKTGTAQWGTDKLPHAWFTAFAPYEDAEIVITVLVEEGEEGSKITAQIANDFLNWYFREYQR